MESNKQQFQFTSPSVRALGEQAAKQLQDFAQTLGLTVTPAGSMRGTSYVDLKLRFAQPAAENPDIRSGPEVEAFRQLAESYGLKTTDLFREITIAGRRLTITGLRTRAKKSPITLRSPQGAAFKAPVAEVKEALRRLDEKGQTANHD